MAKFGSGPKAEIKDFTPKLQVLCAATLADNRSREDAAEMIEALLSALAFTMAMASGGNPKALDELCHGANAYLVERCVEHRRAGEVLGHIVGK
jgi:hypothetical protein